MNGPVLLATDGSSGAAGAVRMARALEVGSTVSVLVVGVVEPVEIHVVSPASTPEVRSALERLATLDLSAAVRAQVETLGSPGWDVRVEVGGRARTIAGLADELGAALIALGLGEHAPAQRWLGRETALQVMQLARVPVLAVHPDAVAPPRRALIAEDFSEHSRHATESALSILPADAEIHLAHVVGVPPLLPTRVPAGTWVEDYFTDVRAALRTRGAELEGERGRVSTHLLQGVPAPELLRIADEIGADLIVAGRHGRGRLARLLIGSVSTRLVRGARCSALVAPAPAPVPN